jgi:hypothetical protein
MKENFYDNDFELFLQQQVEDFKMTPNENVWFSIYNNFHPTSKKPSVLAAVLLCTLFLTTGILHKPSKTLVNNTNNPIVANKQISAPKNNVVNNTVAANNISQQIANIAPTVKNKTANYTAKNNSQINPAFATGKTLASGITISTNSNSKPTNITAIASNTTAQSANKNYFSAPQPNTEGPLVNEEKTLQNPSLANTTQPFFVANNSSIANSAITTKKQKALVPNAYLVQLSNAIKTKKTKQQSKFSIEYMAGAGLSYSTLKADAKKVNSFITTTAGGSTGPINPNASYTPIIRTKSGASYFAGFGFKYHANKNIQVKIGAQFYAATYHIIGKELGHPYLLPVLTRVNNSVTGLAVMENTAEGNEITTVKTNQLLLPIGVNLKIAGANKLQWYVGASAIPSVVIGANAMALSTDNKYFVANNDLQRKTNLYFAAETFLQYQLHDVEIIFGPQLFWQSKTNLVSQVTTNERIHMVGLKLGVAKKF